MGYGCWPKGGRRSKWLRLWTGRGVAIFCKRNRLARWHGLWLLAQGWSAIQVAEALERAPHTIGNWLANFRRGGAQGLVFEQTGGSPPS